MDQAHGPCSRRCGVSRGALMPRFVAFLRAINVGGHTVTMEELRRLFQALGLKNVETFIASGNVIFESPATNSDALAKRIERHLHKALGYEVHTFLRTDREVADISTYNAFSQAQVAACRALNVAFLAAPLDDAGRKNVMALKTDIDDFHVNGRELYWMCKVGQSESTFSNMRFEKALKVRATFRGINTVARLAARYPPAAGTKKR
jgi:uncharacterized protein (DUF1697 family)